MNEKLKRLQEAAQAALKAARDAAAAADQAARDMTDDERKTFDENMAKARELHEQIKTVKADQVVLDEAKKLADEIGMPESAKDDIDATGREKDTRERVKSLGLQVVESPQFKAMLAPFAGRVPEKARIQSDPIQIKSLITGASDTSGGAFVVAEQTGIVEMLGRRPLTVRNLISVRRTGSDTVEYVRQTSHTNAAAPVAEATTAAAATANTTTGVLELPAGSGVKPEGAWAFERDTATVKTIAEWVPASKRALADVAQLEGLINDELRADLAETEEDQILNGDGVGENLPGILNTAGIQTQAFATDIFTTIRKALTKAKTVGRVVPNGILMNPSDTETVDLVRDNSGGAGTGQFMGGGPFAQGAVKTLWGVPVVESEAIAAGSALVGDFRKAVLWDREQASVTMTDSHADFFTRNLVAILGEERVAFAVTRPTAFVEAALA